jgi:L-seryl-tRNA(Ser) seleniumtransferase
MLDTVPGVDCNSGVKRALRGIPAVEKILHLLGPCALPRAILVDLVRSELAALRKAKTIPPTDEIVVQVKNAACELLASRIQPMINGTGILIHTNLGRAPLSRLAVEALTAAAANFNNLEFDLASGERGSRGQYVEKSLALLCGAEAATVVNNCAAALVLVLRHFVTESKDEVIVSRGELIQIGGGFRIPDILQTSGAQLREVGTTNKTSLADYAKAVGPRTALILKVHHSNFFMGGFVESPTTEEIASLARKKRIPLAEDLGSGAVVATEKLAGVQHEPTPAEVLRKGVDVVTFSGDKLLGGPQAGIVAGRAKIIERLKREPFFRALRCDKLVLAALQATVEQYLAASEQDLPIIKMLCVSNDDLRARAEKVLAILAAKAAGRTSNTPSLEGKSTTSPCWAIGDGKAQIGGGTLPRSDIPSVTMDFSVADLHGLAARLRSCVPPVIGYIAGRRLKIDLRTVFPEQDSLLAAALLQAL